MYPKISANYFQERDGVIRVAGILNNLGLIFRETSNADVGIDGQIEYVSIENETTGKIVAAQIKSGKSYLKDRGDCWAFYPSEKHWVYWENFPIPVLLLLHDPESDKIYFLDVRHFLNIPKHKNSKYIPVPKSNLLNKTTKEILFKSFGEIDKPLVPLKDVLHKMIWTSTENRSFPVSYFDLFINGLTNICRHIYFSFSLAYEIAKYNSKLLENNNDFFILNPFPTEFLKPPEISVYTSSGISVSGKEHDYLHGFVRYLIEQNLAKVDYGDYLVDWESRQIQPDFLAPITNRGRELFEIIRESENNIITNNYGANLICERSMSMVYLESDLIRMKKSFDYQELYCKANKQLI